MKIPSIFDILQKLNKYQGNSWDDIKNNPRFHFHIVESGKIENKCKGLHNLANGTNIYQLAIDKAKRVLGFKSDCTFHLMAVDLNHKFYS